MGLSMWQVVLVLLIVILLFGRGRIPALMGDVAAGIRSFKQGMGDEKPEVQSQSAELQNAENNATGSKIVENPLSAEQKNA